jgi:parallel beta-helix repeat protein
VSIPSSSSPSLPAAVPPRRGKRPLVLALSGAAVLALAAAPLVLAPTLDTAQAAQATVDCDAGGSLARAVSAATTGDTLVVRGTCEESVHVPRTIRHLTITGEDGATVVGPEATAAPTGPSAFTFFVEGEGVTLQNLEIRGGFHAVHLSGPSSATIVGNTITKSAGAIHLDKGSTAQIAGNTITGNVGYGINVQEDSYARIGFTAPTRGLVPNVVSGNEGDGIRIDRWSSAWVSGNEITGNGGTGVLVDRQSRAEVADNTIESNARDGIRVRTGSGVLLTPEGAESPTTVAGNRTAKGSPNRGAGLRCEADGYVSGDLGGLRGTQRAHVVDHSCTGEVRGQSTNRH